MYRCVLLEQPGQDREPAERAGPHAVEQPPLSQAAVQVCLPRRTKQVAFICEPAERAGPHAVAQPPVSQAAVQVYPPPLRLRSQDDDCFSS